MLVNVGGVNGKIVGIQPIAGLVIVGVGVKVSCANGIAVTPITTPKIIRVKAIRAPSRTRAESLFDTGKVPHYKQSNNKSKRYHFDQECHDQFTEWHPNRGEDHFARQNREVNSKVKIQVPSTTSIIFPKSG